MHVRSAIIFLISIVFFSLSIFIGSHIKGHVLLVLESYDVEIPFYVLTGSTSLLIIFSFFLAGTFQKIKNSMDHFLGKLFSKDPKKFEASLEEASLELFHGNYEAASQLSEKLKKIDPSSLLVDLILFWSKSSRATSSQRPFPGSPPLRSLKAQYHYKILEAVYSKNTAFLKQVLTSLPKDIEKSPWSIIARLNLLYEEKDFEGALELLDDNSHLFAKSDLDKARSKILSEQAETSKEKNIELYREAFELDVLNKEALFKVIHDKESTSAETTKWMLETSLAERVDLSILMEYLSLFQSELEKTKALKALLEKMPNIIVQSIYCQHLLRAGLPEEFKKQLPTLFKTPSGFNSEPTPDTSAIGIAQVKDLRRKISQPPLLEEKLNIFGVRGFDEELKKDEAQALAILIHEMESCQL